MDAHKSSSGSGTRLKELRLRLGLTTRDVEAKSHQIAEEEHNRECKSPNADSGLPMNPNGEPSRQGKQEKQDCDVVDIEGAHHPGWVVIENGISCLFGI